MGPAFLDLDRVLRTHRSLIETYGGAEGVRDVGLLQSAIATPQASFGGEFLHKSLFEMAAAYLYHIVQNHPFVDGNKRTGAAAAIIFLAMNGVNLEADEEGLVGLTLAVAEGKVGKEQIAGFFRQIARGVVSSLKTRFCRRPPGRVGRREEPLAASRLVVARLVDEPAGGGGGVRQKKKRFGERRSTSGTTRKHGGVPGA